MHRYLLALLICGCGGGDGTVSSALAKKCQDSCGAADVCVPDECGDELTTASDCVDMFCAAHPTDPACDTGGQ